MDENISKLTVDLAQNDTGRTKTYNPKWEAIREKIDKFDITEDMVLPEMKHLLQVGGINCFPRGDLVAISGKEKCGKTTDCRIMVSALLRGEYMDVMALEQDVRVLWIDTEQASLSSRAVCRGIKMMCGFALPHERFRYSALREYPDREELTETLRYLFDSFKPDIAIIDGIRDFIPDFNDVVESSEIVLECMQLSSGVSAEKSRETGLNQRPPCCVCCILHQNKPKDDTNMRGHLGTELSNKAGEVWEATQDEDHVFSFKQTRSRTRPITDPIQYKVHSEVYVDPNTGKAEEIGIPEGWTTEPIAEETPREEYVVTRNGPVKITTEQCQMMFYKVMGFGTQWLWRNLISNFSKTWGVDYRKVGYLKDHTDNHVFEVTIDGKNYWQYNGPSFILEE